MKPKTIIYVDVHERDAKLLQWLKVLDCELQERAMDTGDIVLDHKGYLVGIEMKRESDFDSSLHSGRLHDQITRLYDNYNYPMLIVENWRGADWDRSNKAMRTLNLRLPVFRTHDIVETVELIKQFVRLLEEKKFQVLRRPIMLQDDPHPGVPVLCAFPHISQRMANEILLKYETPLNALLHLDEWTEINGITDERLEAIRKVWGKV
jgi:DNA excision repair protein ERCC-4